MREFEDRLFGMRGTEMLPNQIEISIPVFLRARTQDILSLGKSTKIIRFLDPGCELNNDFG